MIIEKRNKTVRTINRIPLIACFDPTVINRNRNDIIFSWFSGRKGANYTTLALDEPLATHRTLILKVANVLLQKHNLTVKDFKDKLLNQEIAIKFYLNLIDYRKEWEEKDPFTDEFQHYSKIRTIPELFVMNIVPVDDVKDELAELKIVKIKLKETRYASVYQTSEFFDIITEGLFLDSITYIPEEYFLHYRNSSRTGMHESITFLKLIKENCRKGNKFKVLTTDKEFIIETDTHKTRTEVATELACKGYYVKRIMIIE